MEEEILKEIEKVLNKKEKILLKLFSKTFIKIFHVSRINLINKMI